jgi:hypothetical protein
LNQVPARRLHQGTLKWVYKARNIVKWCGLELSASTSDTWASSFRNSLTMQ